MEHHWIVVDGSGHVFVVWQNCRNSIGVFLRDIYAQKIDTDGNLLWGNDCLGVCTQIDNQTDPELALYEDYNIIIT